MKFGVNTFVWVSPLTTEAVAALAPKVKAFGFDLLELAVEDTACVDVPAVKAALENAGLETIVCGAFGPDRNLCSPDAAIRENAKAYIRWLVDAAAALDSPVVAGPMYSAVGKAHEEDPAARQAEWDLAVAGVREMADYAGPKGVRLALETLNRFETDMLNTVAQGLSFIQAVGRANVGLHLDTFHMHLEEKSSAAAIRLAGERIFHFHACENDRGVPGTGQVHWQSVFTALNEVGYDGPVVIESFTPEVKEIARAVCIWREIAPSQDAIAEQGLQFLKAAARSVGRV
ncbi:MAG TPA: sugar phosphate isomerase/epimerase family protein [Anaerolineaceae bacterium]|nr:sugar phosphate isomerase/epimerase family protein [Anaerolineaceae bacterium]